MDVQNLDVFVREVARQCQFVQLAASDVELNIRRRGGTGRVMFSLQGLVSSAGNVSKLLWPVKAEGAARGKALRSLLSVADDSPLNSRKLRNALEHYDEHLDNWAETTESGNLADDLIFVGGVQIEKVLPGFDEREIHRAFLHPEWAYWFRGTKFQLRPLIQATQELYLRAVSSDVPPFATKEEAERAGRIWQETAPLGHFSGSHDNLEDNTP